MIPAASNDQVLMSEHQYYDHSPESSTLFNISLGQIALLVAVPIALCFVLLRARNVWFRSRSLTPTKGEIMV